MGRDAYGRPTRAAALLLASLALLAAPGADGGPPEVVRVRVPSARVASWFPKEAPLGGLPLAEFEDLVDRARRGWEDSSRPGPRLIRARHSARWVDGMLVGRSELFLDPGDDSPGLLPLEPWTPAVVDAPGTDPPWCSDAAGRFAIRAGAGDGKSGPVVVDWQLRASPDTGGRSFALGLPACDASGLVLELPEGLTPEGPAGIRQGPAPADEPKLRVWRFDGPGGRANLLLRDASGPGRAPAPLRPVVAGPTTVELDGSHARWRAEWALEAAGQAPGELALVLDPGLELVDVAGPTVLGFRPEPDGEGTRVTVRLREEPGTAARIEVSAVAPVPARGAWVVPSARPVDAVWAGGTTTVRLDAARVLRDCREQAGRRVATRPEPPASGPPVLTFEALEPRPVAELEFAPPAPDPRVEVRGRIALRSWSARLEANLTWTTAEGRPRPIALGFELPAGWALESIAAPGGGAAPAWEAEDLPGGATRYRVAPPSDRPSGRAVALEVVAAPAGPQPPGRIELPRLRPVDARIDDERWVLVVPDGMDVRPAEAAGLAWLDPGSTGIEAALTAPTPADVRGRLAWRWTSDRGAATLEFEAGREPNPGEARTDARIAAGRVSYVATVTFEEGPGRGPLAIGSNGRLGVVPAWRVRDGSSSTPIEAQPVGPGRRDELGLPPGGDAWEFSPPARPGPLTLEARWERPWAGDGRLAWLALPPGPGRRGTVAVRVDRSLQFRAEPSGLRPVDPSASGSGGPNEAEVDGPAGPSTPDLAFELDGDGGSLRVRTEPLEPAGTAAAIRLAYLQSQVDPRGVGVHRLTLRVAAAGPAALTLRPAPGARLERLSVDGQAVAPIVRGEALQVPLAATGPNRAPASVVLQYRTDRPAWASGALAPPLPSADLPCLNFVWELALPSGWAAGPPSGGLASADPEAGFDPFAGPAGPELPGDTERARRGAGLAPASAQLARDRLGPLRSGEMTLGDYLTRWDGGPTPLVVDRLALLSAGWGPRSRVAPGEDGPGPLSGLRALGLDLVALDGIVLLTTAAEASRPALTPAGDPARRRAWSERAREAARAGADAVDRFQAVPRWRGEMTPRATGGEAAGDGFPGGRGWSTWRFVSSGWPASGASVWLRDDRGRIGLAWVLGLLVLGLGVAPWPRSGPVVARALALGVVAWAGVVALALGGPATRTVGAGLLWGSSGAALFAVGRSLGWPRPGRAVGPRPGSTVRAAALRAAGPALLVSGMFGGLAAAIAQPEVGRPILALLPYDGPPGADDGPGRVVLALADLARLRELAGRARGEAPAVASAVRVAHRLTRDDDGTVVAESLFDLRVEGRGPAEWPMPVGPARDLSATLDGVAVPLRLDPEGRTATVALEGPGAHRLAFRRVATPDRAAGGEVVALPVNPVAVATLSVRGRPVPGTTLDLPECRGRVEPAPGGVDGRLGPVERIEAAWRPAGRPGPVPRASAVEGLLLWDVEPAGDRLRARLSYADPRGLSRLRFALEDGLVLRSARAPGLVEVGAASDGEGLVATLRVEPPLAPGAIVELDLWRPRPGGDGGRRAIPRVEPLDAPAYSGLVALRRPGDWQGRLAAGADARAGSDEAFVRAWGELPAEPLTLAGAARFDPEPEFEVAVGPAPARATVRPTLRASVEPGRVGWALAAEVQPASGRVFALGLSIPPALRIAGVEGGGLTDWSRPSADRLLLRFDGPAPGAREVRVEGSIPEEFDPLAALPRPAALDLAWPRWEGADAEPGRLELTGPPTLGLESGRGLAAAPAEPPGMINVRVDRPEAVARLRWIWEPPGATVAVGSHLTLEPDTAVWRAALDYELGGGPASTLYLSLPADWAERARLVEAPPHRLRAESRGGLADWRVELDRPAWGRARLVLRAERDRPEGEALAFPDLSPRGRGRVETFLGYANASGRAAREEGRSGLLPAEPDRLREARLPTPRDPAGPTYRVVGERWGLRLRADGPRRPARSGGEAATVTLADLAAVLSADGSVVGIAHLDCVAGSGDAVSIRLPDGCEPILATADQAPAAIYRAPSGAWRVPLDPVDAARVSFAWRGRLGPAGPDGRASVPLPTPEARDQGVPTFASVYLPEAGWRSARGEAGAEPIALAEIELGRAERSVDALADRVAALDREQARGRETIVAALVQAELRLRMAERALGLAPSTGPGARVAPALPRRLEAARSRLEGFVREAGLDELARRAAQAVGRGEGGHSARQARDLEDTEAPLRLGRIGRGWFFRVEPAPGPATGPGPAIMATPQTGTPAGQPRQGGAWPVALGLGATLMLAFTAGRELGLRRVLALTLPATAAAAALGLGPWPLAAGWALVTLGRATRP